MDKMDNIVNETSNKTTCFIQPDTANGILIAIYTTVMIGGTIGIIIMLSLLCRTNTRSVTITVIINLLVNHGIFILTVPFRIAYYIQNEWIFTFEFCRFISSMIHIHMYLSFIFYVALIIIRYISYFKQKDKIEFYRKMHSVVASATVWIIILVVVLPVILLSYGTDQKEYWSKQCFKFHKEIKRKPFVAILNYITVAVIFLVVCILLIVQMFIIVKIVKRLKRMALDHQEFWAQLKSLFFILVMVICFFPYHMFRVYFLHHTSECFYYNEIFLGITALSCLDLLSFAVQPFSRKCFST